MTGFRLAKGGAQEIYGVTPDLTTFGKIIGGGLPVGRVIEVFGPESSGKTTLALHTVAEVQKKGGVAAFVDASPSSYHAAAEVARRLEDAGFTALLETDAWPQAPGRYLVGVECDGATYHSSATARDRDRLREHVLTDLGWRIRRVWSTEWWMDAEGALAKLQKQRGKAQDKLTQLGKASGVPIAFFHGRGGSVSRGGGKTDRIDYY